MLNAFMTGSRVYGTPTDKSDVDLVVLVSPNDAMDLFLLSDSEGSCRYGNANLIVLTDESEFNTWKRVTDELFDRSPVTRDEAIKAFNMAGITGLRYNPSV